MSMFLQNSSLMVGGMKKKPFFVAYTIIHLTETLLHRPWTLLHHHGTLLQHPATCHRPTNLRQKLAEVVNLDPELAG